MTANREDPLEDAWDRLADEYVKVTRTNLRLISHMRRAGLLPSSTAAAMTASTDQLEAQAAELHQRHPPDHGLRIRQPD